MPIMFDIYLRMPLEDERASSTPLAKSHNSE
jgi:hypothetical protein